MLNAIYVFCFVTVAGLSFVERELTQFAIAQEPDPFRAQTYTYSSWDRVKYFPRGSIPRHHSHDGSYFLFHMDEPVLKSTPVDEGYAVVRLVVVTSFGPVFVFRAEEREGVYSIIRKVGFTTYGGWGPIERVDEKVVEVSKADFDAILGAAQMASVSKSSHGGMVFDGAGWVLETAGRTSYTVAAEQSPDVEPWYELVRRIRGALPLESVELETDLERWNLGRDPWPIGLGQSEGSLPGSTPLFSDTPPVSPDEPEDE